LSVSGPAAGLTVIVAAGIAQAGSYEAFLTSVVLAGLLQMGFGLLRWGFFATVFPNSVIKGMLTAIGITIFLKQIPHALGGAGGMASDVEWWSIVGNDSLAADIARAVTHVTPAAPIICLGTLAVLFAWEMGPIRRHPLLSKVPGPLLGVAIGVVLNEIFHHAVPTLALGDDRGQLVALPVLDSFDALWKQLRFPDWSYVSTPAAWATAATLAAIASIETLLCLESTDRMDPERRTSDKNRELLAQGIGNVTAGMLGGIPMTSVIVRSSANIYAGARSRWSAIFHGGLLLVSVVMLAGVLNQVPLASLSAVLLVIGAKLARPATFRDAWRSGHDQFVPFVTTVVAILATDLLKGVLIGTGVGLGYALKKSWEVAVREERRGDRLEIRLLGDVTFVHKVRLERALQSAPSRTRVVVDGTQATIDQDIRELLRNQQEKAQDRGVSLELLGFEPDAFEAPRRAVGH
jgi:MFS superfamily sulfate permease-like transporter